MYSNNLNHNCYIPYDPCTDAEILYHLTLKSFYNQEAQPDVTMLYWFVFLKVISILFSNINICLVFFSVWSGLCCMSPAALMIKFCGFCVTIDSKCFRAAYQLHSDAEVCIRRLVKIIFQSSSKGWKKHFLFLRKWHTHGLCLRVYALSFEVLRLWWKGNIWFYIINRLIQQGQKETLRA